MVASTIDGDNPLTFDASSRFEEREADRIVALKLPERAAIAPPSVRESDIDLLSKAPPRFIDTTHFDTVRFPPPPWAEQRFVEAARDGANAYTGYRGHDDVLAEVAANVGRFLGIKVDPRKNLILTPGTQAALFATLSARVSKGERIAVFDPDYLFTARILGFLGAEAGYVPLRLDDAGSYAPDLGLLEEEFARRKTRHLVFSHPNNPTGAVYSSRTIAAIASLARQYGVSVIVDELYSRLVYDGTIFTHLAAEDGMAEHTATLLGPSKTESLSGYRIGVVVGNEKLIRAVENVLSITSLRAPAYAQHVLKGWLAGDDNWLKSRIVDFKSLRDSTAAALWQLPWLKLTPQQGTAYHWPDVSALGLPDAEVAGALLEKAGVLVSPGYQFGPMAAGHFRICYARDEESWARALDRMVDVLGNLKARRRA
jgi:aspartate/methionine/tyrosine aminotransferase